MSVKLYATGMAKLDAHNKDFGNIYKRVLLQREKVLQLLDKTSSSSDRHITSNWSPTDSLLGVLSAEPGTKGDEEQETTKKNTRW